MENLFFVLLSCLEFLGQPLVIECVERLPVHGMKCGPRPYLSPDEELQLSEFIVEVDQAGFGKTRREIVTPAENVVHDKGMLRGSRVTSGWFRRFMERHPDLSLRKGDVTANV